MSSENITIFKDLLLSTDLILRRLKTAVNITSVKERIFKYSTYTFMVMNDSLDYLLDFCTLWIYQSTLSLYSRGRNVLNLHVFSNVVLTTTCEVDTVILPSSWQSEMLVSRGDLVASKFGKLSSGHRTGKGQFSFQSQRKAQTTAQLHSSHTLVR